MEYPTLVTGRHALAGAADGAGAGEHDGHEAGHQWWYGMVATNEFEHAWMDEGINTYATARVIDGGVEAESHRVAVLRRLRPVGRFATSRARASTTTGWRPFA